ncbi:hypothetical protein N657DRAFT_275478 [Parathielavia appendiculata]|uniref:Uncharacterized protein n=1 Tax=Parathielavia appendiculata TaxID=2587402 RepID=A0AAN6U4C2_9PEZI|nr:hypothetical protein N657DRAFT_275478 [Parathielavia appendiculata]
MSNQLPSNIPSWDSRQSSPWLCKFGGHARSVLNNPREPLAHFGLAPRIPDLHPIFYAEDNEYFRNLAPFAKPSDYELDMLFATEDAQQSMNGGLTTWELAVLNERLVNGWPGGHRQSDSITPRLLDYNGLGTQVDESSWHPAFRKTKWYDFRVPIVDGKFTRHAVPGITATDVWSVDVPAVWKELREPIELANRWFRHMVTGSWLNNLCWETRTEWMEAEPAPGDFHSYPDPLGPNRKPYRVPSRHNHCDGERVLKYVAEKVAPLLIWTFIDDFYHIHDSANETDQYGRTAREWDGGVEPKEDTPPAERPAPFMTTYIHVKPLRVYWTRRQPCQNAVMPSGRSL